MRAIAVLAVVGAGLLVLTAPVPARIHRGSEARQPWDSSYAPPGSRIVRLIVTVGGQENVKRAAIRETGGEVRITIVRTAHPGAHTGSATVGCYEIVLRSPAGTRRRVDGASGRTHEHPRRGVPEAVPSGGPVATAQRRGPCPRLRENFYGRTHRR